MSLSGILHRAADTAERVEGSISSSRRYAKTALIVLALMAVGAFITGALISSIIASPATLGTIMALPFAVTIMAIYRATR